MGGWAVVRLEKRLVNPPTKTAEIPLANQGGLVLVSPLVSEREGDMKSDTHPAYSEATITCACGNVIKTRSTVKEMFVNTCSACHPFFTGQATFIDTEGRVEHFMKRYNRK
jgi:large subunit ribosomal protein L31